ncbi:MAG: hypothetical protein Q9157_004040, partial [Trypethelium eluteriae]
MASRSIPPAAQKCQRTPNEGYISATFAMLYNQIDFSSASISKATRRSARIEVANRKGSKSRTDAKQQAPNLQEQEKQTHTVGSHVLDVKRPSSIKQPREHPRIQDRPQLQEQIERQKRHQEVKATPSTSLKQSPKRVRTIPPTINKARLGFWTEEGRWPTEEQEKTMDRFRDIVQYALPRKRTKSSLRRKRSDASVGTETVQTRTPSDQSSREQKSAPYRYPRYEGQLQERGSFIDDHDKGITKQSEELLAKLLKTPRKPPENTLFSDDILFKKTCKSLRGENETKVILRVTELIFPSAEVLADRGAKHLKILRETTNAGWINAIPFFGPCPQPDFGLGFKREAFNQEQLQRLRAFIGNKLEDCSYIAATYN